MLILERGPQWGKPLWVIWSLGAFDMGPGLHYYIILILEIFVVVVLSPTLDSYSTNFPQFLAMLHPVVFAQKCSTQSVKVIPYVSLYLYVFPIIWHIPVCPCPLPLRTLTPIPWGLLLMAFAKNLAEDHHGSKPCPSSQVWAGSRGLGPGPPCSEIV